MIKYDPKILFLNVNNEQNNLSNELCFDLRAMQVRILREEK